MPEASKVLSAAELDPAGFPREPMAIEPIEHRGQTFWLARYPMLPGYSGGGASPSEAAEMLVRQFDGGPIYRVSIPAYSKKRHQQWVETTLKARAAASETEGIRESRWVADVAKKHTVRKQTVDDTYRKMVKSWADAGIEDPEIMRHLERSVMAPQNRQLARYHLENLRPDEVEDRWARERFPMRTNAG